MTYLKKREEQQLELKRLQLEEEDRLFAGVTLTHLERQKLDIERKLYEIALKRRNLKEDTIAYRIPDQVDEQA